MAIVGQRLDAEVTDSIRPAAAGPGGVRRLDPVAIGGLLLMDVLDLFWVGVVVPWMPR